MKANHALPISWQQTQPALTRVGAQGSPEDYIDVNWNYDYVVSDLPANGTFKGNWIAVDTDADFLWRFISYSDQLEVNLLFYDSLGRFYSNNIALSALNVYAFYVLQPQVRIPAGANIGFDIINPSPSPVPTARIQVYGVKRYRMTKGMAEAIEGGY